MLLNSMYHGFFFHFLLVIEVNEHFFFLCRGCLLVRQSFFHNEPRNFVDLGGGVVGCRGFHSSFRATQGGLSLNMGKFLNHFLIYEFLLLKSSMYHCFMTCRCFNHHDC